MKKSTGIILLAVSLLVALTAYVLAGEEKTEKAEKAAAATMDKVEKKAGEEAKMVKAETTEMAGAAINQPAPKFTLAGADGKKYSLADFAGKWVVLEWVNLDCPFVKKHYSSKNMQTLQKKYADKGVVWLSICSSAPEKQGNFTGDALSARIKESEFNSAAYLIDADGKVGKTYGAKTTPHMFVINPGGNLVYAGAIDDKPSTKLEDVEGATNYVAQALDAGMSGEVILVSSTPSYGCSVKY